MTAAKSTVEEPAAGPAESVVRTYLERWDVHQVEGIILPLGVGQVITSEKLSGDSSGSFYPRAWPGNSEQAQIAGDDSSHKVLRASRSSEP